MIDTVTKKPIEVSVSGGLPYLNVPYLQLDKVRALLDSNHISYWVDEEVLSIDGGPETAFINLDEETDAESVQRALDSAP